MTITFDIPTNHTTKPRMHCARYRDSAGINSHLQGEPSYERGNWNRHKKRRIESSMRTVGRQARYFVRHPDTADLYQLEWAQQFRGGSRG